MYTLSRRGEFFAVPKGCTHCGINSKQSRFGYEYQIVSKDNGLDEKGFVVDNLRMEQWFDELGEISESCELLACRAAKAFATFCRAPHVIKVRIQPFNGAWVEYEFECD